MSALRGAVLGTLRGAGDGNALVAAVSWTICLGFAWVLLWIGLDPMRPFDFFHRAWAWAGAVLVVGAMLAVARWGTAPAHWLEERPRVRRVGGAVLLAVGAVAMLRVAMAVRFPPGWDAGAVEDWGHALAHDRETAKDYTAMAERYPNNLALVGALARWYQLCDLLGVPGMGSGTIVLNVLVLSVAVVLVWALARRLGGPVAGLVAMLPTVPLVIVSPWLGVAYSDTLGTIFPIGILLLLLVARDSASARVQMACWVGIGLLGLAGYRLKPTVVFALAAALAAVVVELRRHGGARAASAYVGRVVAGLLVGVLLASAALSVVVGRTGILPEGDRRELATPPTHFLMMGAGLQVNPETGRGSWGGYNGADLALTESVPPAERFGHSFEVWTERVRAWGLVGYPRFLNEKATWMLGDGNFNAFQHGLMAHPDQQWDFDDPLSRELRPWLTIHHEEYRWVALVRQSTWLAVLLLMVAPVFSMRPGAHALPASVLRLSLAGVFTFLLFFEGGSRYLYLYLPVVLVLASLSAVRWVRPVGPAVSTREDPPATMP